MKLPEGFLLSAINCGIHKSKLDLGAIACPGGACAIGLFTANRNVSYSVTCSRRNIKNTIKAVLVNSGNANCFSHAKGLDDTRLLLNKFAGAFGTGPANTLIASTGIIGKKMPYALVGAGLARLADGLGSDIDKFSKSILTTDTFPKVAYCRPGKSKAGILGIAKGAGMIAPNMATMLGFILTDADIPKAELRAAARGAVDCSFNAISVDGCMSTNDTVFILSSKKRRIAAGEKKAFCRGLEKVCFDLARMIVKDGEGATKLITLDIKGAASLSQAKRAAESIANSNLFKCAVYGEDANWGRIIAALGHAGIKVGEDVAISSTDLKRREVTITVNLKQGRSGFRFLTADLTPEYIKINADYN